MSILDGAITIKASEEEVAWSEDEDVGLPDELKGCGWIPASKCSHATKANTATLRALSPSERLKVRDVAGREGSATAYYTACLSVLRRVGARRKPSEVRAWLDAMAQTDWRVIDLAALRGLAITAGQDPAQIYPIARRTLGYEPAPEGEEGATDAGGTKS